MVCERAICFKGWAVRLPSVVWCMVVGLLSGPPPCPPQLTPCSFPPSLQVPGTQLSQLGSPGSRLSRHVLPAACLPAFQNSKMMSEGKRR